MDYKERYEHALKRAKAAIDIAADKDLVKGVASTIFPELRESEDERIRKEIRNFLIDMECKKEWIAYMEKQKEPAPIPDKFSGLKSLMLQYLQSAANRKDDTEIEDDTDLYGRKILDYVWKQDGTQKEQKPKMPPKWLYRLEYKDASCGLWYNGKGKWCFESGIGAVDGCKTKTLPMDYDERYKQDGRDWFSSCSQKEDLLHWYSLEDAKKLISKGFVFTRYLATEYHEYDQQTVFIKETSLYREEIDIFELFEQKPAEWSEEDEKMLVHVVELLELNCDFSEINNEISWLKSLSRKKIWNKEDERILKGIVGLIDHNQHYDVSNKDMLNWLKSLRPQPHWKPSEEQMEALEEAVSRALKSYRAELVSLRDDLDKYII